MAGILIPTNAYCDVGDVNEHLPHRTFTATSRPSIRQLEDQIIDIAGEINAELRALEYSPPLTGMDDRKVLRRINAFGAAGFAERAALAATPSADRAAVNEIIAEFTRMMESLRAGGYKFATASSPGLVDPEIHGDLYDSTGDRATPMFILDMDDQEF